MQVLSINPTLSRKVYEDLKEQLHLKGCYNNTWAVATHYLSKMHNEEWLVGFGFMHVLDKLYTRHAFLIDKESNQVIDATICIRDKENDPNLDYYLFAIFTFDEYSDRIANQSDMSVNLFRSLQKEEAAVRKEMKKLGLIAHS